MNGRRRMTATAAAKAMGETQGLRDKLDEQGELGVERSEGGEHKPGAGVGAPVASSRDAAPARSAVVKSGEPQRAVPVVHADENGHISPSQLIMAAIDRGIPPESLEKLVGLQERLEAREAAKEFAQALAAFKAECPPVFKSKVVEIEKRSGGTYGYSFAPLEDIIATIDPYLTKHGLSYRWDHKCEKPGFMTSVCTLEHLNGHTRTSSFELPTENSNPGMSVQQKYAGGASFGDRKSLQAVLGIVAGDEDKAATQAVDPTPISDDQVIEIEDLLRELTKGKPVVKAESIRKRFFKYLDVDSVAKIRAADYDVAVAALQPQEAP